MFKERMLLDKPVPVVYSPEIERRLFFVSDSITDFRIVTHGEVIREIELTTSRPVDMQQLASKVNFLVNNDIARQKIIPPKVVWRSDRQASYTPNMFDLLVERGIAYQAGEGQVCLGEPFIHLMDVFDRALKNIAIEQLNAKEYQYPTLIPTHVLNTCGYFGSFPHFLMFVTRLHSDTDTYRAFLDDYRARNGIGPYMLSYCENVDYCLPPTMCFHTYHQFRERELGNSGPIVVTSRGKSFRFESRYYTTLERLWDFTIREIVFIGSRDFVLDCRQKYMNAAIDFIKELGLAGHCEVANDPFFCDLDTAQKIWSQKVLELKYELRLNVTEERTIAAGSFNFHENFFGEGFHIRQDDGEWARTACVGFGLERLVYAFLCQYGLDERAWPRIARG